MVKIPSNRSIRSSATRDSEFHYGRSRIDDWFNASLQGRHSFVTVLHDHIVRGVGVSRHWRRV